MNSFKTRKAAIIASIFVLLVIFATKFLLVNKEFYYNVNNTYRLSESNLREKTIPEYLDLLTSSSRANLIIISQVDGWVTEDDIGFLLGFVGDKSQCMSVALAESSFRDGGISDIDTEVRFLLLGVKEGSYPPALNSTRMSNEEMQGIVVWARSKIIRSGGEK